MIINRIYGYHQGGNYELARRIENNVTTIEELAKYIPFESSEIEN